MTDSFEKWINGMSDTQYEDWLDDEATEKQEEIALNIREPLSDEELEQIEQEQYYRPPTRPEPEIEKQPTIPDQIYDFRDLPPKVLPAKVIIPPTGKAPIVIPPTRIIYGISGAPIKQAPSIRPTLPKSTPMKRPNIFTRFRTRITSFRTRITSFFRRKR